MDGIGDDAARAGVQRRITRSAVIPTCSAVAFERLVDPRRRALLRATLTHTSLPSHAELRAGRTWDATVRRAKNTSFVPQRLTVHDFPVRAIIAEPFGRTEEITVEALAVDRCRVTVTVSTQPDVHEASLEIAACVADDLAALARASSGRRTRRARGREPGGLERAAEQPWSGPTRRRRSWSRFAAVVRSWSPRQRLVAMVGLACLFAPQLLPGGRVGDVGELRHDVAYAEGYTLLSVHDDGRPVGWNACAPISWVLDSDRLLPGAAAEIRGFMNELAAHPSFPRFVYAGEASLDVHGRVARHEAVSVSDPAVVVGFGDALELTGRPTVAGIGGPRRTAFHGTGWQYTHGAALLDAGHWQRMTASERRSVLWHEIGHVLGLGHADGPGQLMSEVGGEELRASDVAGLDHLLGVGCLPKPVDQGLLLPGGLLSPVQAMEIAAPPTRAPSGIVR